MSVMSNLAQEIIETDAGDYTVTWLVDEAADKPYNEGLGFAFDGGRDRIDVSDGKHSDEVLAILKNNITGWRSNGVATYRHSSAGIARYLRLKYGLKGIREVSYDYDTYKPSTDRERVYGIAWAPDDVPDEHANDYTDSAIAEYRAWAEGDCFGWSVTDPAGEIVDDCWGYYGFSDQRDYTLSEARAAAEHDAAQRAKNANLVGAGFIGIV